MHALPEQEFSSKVEPIFKQVFANYQDETDAFGEPFAPKISSRIILFPCIGGIFSDCFSSQVLVSAATRLGDTGCYILPFWNGLSDYCYVPLTEFVEGFAGEPGSNTLIGAKIGVNPYSSESAIVSSQGKWGLLMSHEYHGLLGGPEEFIEEIRQVTPGIDHQVYEFFEHWQNHRERNLSRGCDPGPYRWLPILLKHVYGVEQGAKLLQESGLPYIDE